jgi:pre-rRNA-processing protein IPI3
VISTILRVVYARRSRGAVGTGQVHVWETASGRLLKSWPAHYKAVTALAFTDDDSLLLSASEDTVVHTWSLLVVLDAFAEDPAPPVPMYSWYD